MRVCVCNLYVCVFMLRVCCIVLLLLLPLLPPVLAVSSALFWSSLGHKTTTYLLARACLALSVCVQCVCVRVFIPRSYRLAIGFIWQWFVCLSACLCHCPCFASLSVSLLVRLHFRSLAVITSFKIKAYIMCLCRYPFMLHSLCLHFIISFTFAT